MQVHQQTEAGEQRRRRANLQDTKVSLALGITVEAVIARRVASESEWATWVTAAMVEHRAETPQEILPVILARVEERIAVIAREVGKIVAEQIIREKLGKALK